jgi:DNA-binding MarR family transcriptional regulator
MRDSRLRDSISNRLGKLFRVMAREHNRALKPLEVSAVQAHILATLWIAGPLTIGDLQAVLALGSSTLTGALDRMEKASLLRRVPVPGDRRAFRLEPAAWPARKKEALLSTLEATEDRCFGALTPNERRELGRLLEKALGSLRGDADGEDDE